MRWEIKKGNRCEWEKEKTKMRINRETWVGVWERNWDDKKIGINMGGREETNEKNSVNFPNFPTTQLFTSTTSTKFDVK